MKHSGQERRRHKRLPELFFVKWQGKADSSPKIWNTAYLKNIAREGLAMHCAQKPQTGDSLRLLVTVQADTTPCACLGVVVWVQRSADKIGYEVGVHFSELDAKQADWIDHLAEEFHKKKAEE